jgi:molybdopterin converting factor small subunit
VIRIVLPAHLRNLAGVDGEVELELEGALTPGAVLDALEQHYPTLRGTIRDRVTLERRPYVRYFACGEDLSHDPPDTALPAAVATGSEPFLIVGALAGGSGPTPLGRADPSKGADRSRRPSAKLVPARDADQPCLKPRSLH